MELGSVQMGDRGLRVLRIRHFDECEAPRLTCVTIGNNIHPLYAPVCRERGLKIVLGSLITEIPYKNVGHSVNPFSLKLSLSDCTETNLKNKEDCGRKALEGLERMRAKTPSV